MLKHVLYSTAALLALTSPLAELPVFLAVTNGQSARQQRRSALKVAFGALVILAVSAVMGTRLLELVGVSLVAIGFQMGFSGIREFFLV